MFTKLLAAVLAVFFVSPAKAAVEWNPVLHELHITGPTTAAQRIAVMRAMDDLDVPTVVLSGDGGDFFAGLFIGRLIKNEGSRVIIPKGKDCVSACAIAAIASDQIIVNGRLLFHRPWLGGMPATMTIETYAGKNGYAYMAMTRYMINMGYTLSFASLIITTTSPCKFIVVTSGAHLRRIMGAPMDMPNLSFERWSNCRLPVEPIIR